MVVTIMVTLLLLTPLFYHTPIVVLSSIIVVVVIGLIDIPAAYFIWKVDKVDFFACMGAFAEVIFISVQTDLLIAVQYIYSIQFLYKVHSLFSIR